MNKIRLKREKKNIITPVYWVYIPPPPLPPVHPHLKYETFQLWGRKVEVWTLWWSRFPEEYAAGLQWDVSLGGDVCVCHAGLMRFWQAFYTPIDTETTLGTRISRAANWELSINVEPGGTSLTSLQTRATGILNFLKPNGLFRPLHSRMQKCGHSWSKSLLQLLSR